LRRMCVGNPDYAMTLLPSPDVLAAFTLAAVVLIVTPGPDMALFLGQTLTAGRSRGLAAMFGVTTGTVVHSLIAAFGLSALLTASAAAFTVLKIAGVAYLVWLAVRALRHGSALTLRRGPAARPPLGQAYLMGLGCNLLNPKIIMFFVTFLPQFVSASDPHAGAKLLFLGLYFVALALPICAGLILAADRFTAAIRRSPRVTRATDWLFAGLMGMFAVRLLLWRAD
jgi:threonine/homoserine/homoserine lactone efflux protein